MINRNILYLSYRLDDDQNNKHLDGTGDDVFVSLDAFDMLTDFQELDILEHAAQHTPSTYSYWLRETNRKLAVNFWFIRKNIHFQISSLA